jgi:hypothetical protein
MATKKTATKATKGAVTKTAKKKVTLTAAPAAKATTKKDATTEKSTRGRKIGALGFKWVKAPKEPWPSVLECNIMDACEAVEQGTSGDVTAYALKHGLGDLTKQIPNKVVTHVMVKLRTAGIIAGTAPAKAEKKVVAKATATPVKKAKKTAKAKKSRVVMEAAPAAPVQDASATA